MVRGAGPVVRVAGPAGAVVGTGVAVAGATGMGALISRIAWSRFAA